MGYMYGKALTNMVDALLPVYTSVQPCIRRQCDSLFDADCHKGQTASASTQASLFYARGRDASDRDDVTLARKGRLTTHNGVVV